MASSKRKAPAKAAPAASSPTQRIWDQKEELCCAMGADSDASRPPRNEAAGTQPDEPGDWPGPPEDSLTPGASAMRAFTVASLDRETCGAVLRFMGAAQYLGGCDFSSDDRWWYGQNLILAWVGLCIECGDLKSPPSAPVALMEAAHDAAVLGYWLSCIEPIQGESFHRGDSISVGQHQIGTLIDALLSAALGDIAKDATPCADPIPEVANA